MRFFYEISLICMHEDLFLHNVKSLIPLNHFHITVYLLSGLCVYNVFILCARARVCVRAHILLSTEHNGKRQLSYSDSDKLCKPRPNPIILYN